jgi:hypothetical protein
MLGLLKVQALFWIAQHSSAPENRIGEFKHVFDEVFPGGKHRHKRAGVPPLAVALLDVVTGKDDDNAKNAKIANLLNGEELDRFRESTFFLCARNGDAFSL